MGKGQRKLILTLVAAVLVLGVCNYAQCTQNAVRDDFHEKLVSDTMWSEKADTLPPPKAEKIYKYIKVQVPISDTDTSVIKEDSLELEVVQRMYSDDSTYTAYVSGVAIDSFPRLDSISVKERSIIIEHIVERVRTTTKQKRLTWGVQTGVGVGVMTRQPDIYIGIGMQWNF